MRTRRQYWICVAVILCLQIVTMIYFGFQKQNFHVDEYFSYYSSSDNDFYIGLQDRAWNKSNITIEKCKVHMEERFNYKNVYEMEAKDVHPPLYYYFLHTICSFFPETFSKWTGLGLNIFFFAVSFILLERITWQLSEGNEGLALAVITFYGFNPAVISAVMFIRMYMLLALLILLFVYVHLGIVKNHYKFSIKRVAAIIAVSFAGFLTHYYFLVLAGIFSGVFAIMTLIESRNIKSSIFNFAACLIGTGAAVLYYPACIEHIFFGYRGEGAQAAFFDLSNTLYRFRYFSHITSRIAFADRMKEIFIAGVLAVAVAGIILWRRRRNNGMLKQYSIWKGAWLSVILATLGYYLLVAKTALMNEDEMVRYTFPVYGFLFLIVLTGFMIAGKVLVNNKKMRITGWGILILGSLALNLYGMKQGSVLFLYPEQKERESFAAAHRNAAVIQVYGNEGLTWEIAEELTEYPEFYCISVNDLSEIEDDTIENADEIVAYIDHSDGQIVQQSIQMIQDVSENTIGYKKYFETTYYDVYLFQ